MQCIDVTNLTLNNLKNVTIQIPLNKYVVFVGKSGSGKSTLAVDAIMSGYLNKMPTVSVPMKPVLFKQKTFIPNSDLSVASFLGINSDCIKTYIETSTKIDKHKKKLLIEIYDILEFEKIRVEDLVRELNLTRFNMLRFFKILLKTNEKLLILDELGAGLCIRELYDVASCFRKLVDNGYSVLAIEHSLPLISQSDYVIELGPGSGEYGGNVIFEGVVSEYKKNKRWKEMLDILKVRTPNYANLRKSVFIGDINYRCFKHLDLKIPVNGIVNIFGFSGCGKSSLLDIIFRACDKSASAWKSCEGIDGIVEGKSSLRRPYMINQVPLGNNAMSTPATYTGIMECLRNMYVNKAEAEHLLFDKSFFSYNSKGRCPKCKGRGGTEKQINDELIYEICNVCQGKRYNEDSLIVKESDMSIGDALLTTCLRLYGIYSQDVKKRIILKKLDFINRIGLSYLKLGQPSYSLSGGESQRIKISKELSKKLGDRCLFILDSPSKGLHMTDIPCVMESLKKLVTKNNSVVIADNNPYFIYMSDWIIYLKDGKILYEGVPKNCPKCILKNFMEWYD